MKTLFLALLFILLEASLFAQTPPTSFQMKDTTSPDKAFIVQYQNRTDVIEIVDTATHKPVATLCESVFANGRNTGEAIWNSDSSIALLFVDWNRVSALTIARKEGPNFVVQKDDPFDRAKSPFSTRDADIKSCRYHPLGWSKPNIFAVGVSILFRNGTTENYTCDIAILRTETQISNWKRIP